jgi:hypothetical protein
MIHATLKHAGGYVDSLNEAAVDELISQVVSSNISQEQREHHLTSLYKEGQELLGSLKKSYAETATLLEGLEPGRYHPSNFFHLLWGFLPF